MVRKKKGLPRALEDPNEDPNLKEGQSPEEFAKEFFGEADQPQPGLPKLDWIKTNFKTKSAAIRYLINQGYKVNAIAKHLGVKYQHVRNVATTPLKRGPNEDWRPKDERTPQPLLPTTTATKKGDGPGPDSTDT